MDSWLPKSAGEEKKGHILNRKSCTLQVWGPVWDSGWAVGETETCYSSPSKLQQIIWQRLDALQGGPFNLGIQQDFRSTVVLFYCIFHIILALCLHPTWKYTLGSEECVHSAHGFLKRQQTSLTIISESTIRPQTSNPPNPEGLMGFAWEQMGFNKVLSGSLGSSGSMPAVSPCHQAVCNIWRRQKAEVPHFHSGYIQKNLEDLHNSSGWR